MRVLALETSCDETSAAVVEDGTTIRSNLISSQFDLHGRFGGVVPEIASRAHLERINPLVEEALSQAGTSWSGIDAVAVTVGPGLVGALLVGIATAKSYAVALGLPLLGVNHLEGHVYANALEHGPLEFPFVAFIVSGGHTMLVHVTREHRYELLGQTLDDAAGEAFDKIARFLGLPYPGGPEIDKLAATGDPHAIEFPRALSGSGDYDFSLSGLKTAVLRHVRAEREAGREIDPADVAASFQEAIVDVQVQKTIAAAKEKAVPRVYLGGGVVANSRLRERLRSAADEAGIRLLQPSPALCTDNAAMVAAAADPRLRAGERTPLDVSAHPSFPLA
ncbi:MAG: tRNA (adenosine(37)-N6)-threonylcarbamoyltransferase complex transferase subunit TsaD [Actinobacteria bacterium]|nr:tRNA (adenosine(37)-N6)-threonylcarbamoyltransferase complex transferase subunit TsaD [Actinomycetota bacterium]